MTTATWFEGPRATKARFSSGVNSKPTGCTRSGRTPLTSKPISASFDWSLTLKTVIVPPISELTQSSWPSLTNSACRGRDATRVLAKSLFVSVSIQCAMLVVSEVVMAILPSGETAMPSGSMPTLIWATTFRVSVSTTVVTASSSLAM